ncbi:MAG: hypothetical protein WBY44_01875 [Bryobacteraceae bacterium]
MLRYLRVSCPYFHPRAPRFDAGDPQSAMLPLGGAWSGVCRAVPGDAWQPEAADVERRCNLGYARGVCPRFPDHGGPDAIRFTVSSDDGAVLRLYYVAERDHHPYAHGPIEYSRIAAIEPPSANCEPLDAQARAYAASYLRRKFEASGQAVASS